MLKANEASALQSMAETRGEGPPSSGGLQESFAFDDEMTEVGVVSYQTSFTDCLENVLKLYPNLDLSSVNMDDIKGEDEAAKQAEAIAPPKVIEQVEGVQGSNDPKPDAADDQQ